MPTISAWLLFPRFLHFVHCGEHLQTFSCSVSPFPLSPVAILSAPTFLGVCGEQSWGFVGSNPPVLGWAPHSGAAALSSASPGSAGAARAAGLVSCFYSGREQLSSASCLSLAHIPQSQPQSPALPSPQSALGAALAQDGPCCAQPQPGWEQGAAALGSGM